MKEGRKEVVVLSQTRQAFRGEKGKEGKEAEKKERREEIRERQSAPERLIAQVGDGHQK